ncbi:hypothetical protein PUR71_07980 [Streptomyces sp. SP17BM10]|uniref:hypothetical protein n=1 Tax=Streptomyces sp. SP17BM10 TaxID=3002530 RepID=UPI002E78FE25|nr:hypothetical protein [Streptomyces sp. SP17BM10]MEE1782853.1 hypothetical protein [Streptomyces sp. SP17BM10]
MPTFRAPPARPTAARSYHQGIPMTATLLLILVPAVLAAAALRPGHGKAGRGGGPKHERR